MIKYEVITQIDDNVFARLFGESIDAMNAGSYPWHLYTNVDTYEDKMAHIRKAFDNTLQNGFVFQVVEDDHVMMLNGGSIEGTKLNWFIGLIGANSAGSKSYLYDPEYQAARDQFWIDQNITNWEVETAGSGTAMYDHLQRAVEAGTIKDSLENKVVEIGPVIASTHACFSV